jgi:ABC-2 type transport system permease protein
VANGQLFPAAALALVLPVFLPITVAIVAGDAVAGEAGAGTLATCWPGRWADYACCW